MFYAQNRKLLGLSFIANTIVKYRRLKKNILYVLLVTQHWIPSNPKTNLKILFPSIAGPPSAAPRINNNNNSNSHTQSNFKRQNTVDTASIKENTARLSTISSRPATATTPTSKPMAPILSPLDSTRKSLLWSS